MRDLGEKGIARQASICIGACYIAWFKVYEEKSL